MTRPSLAGIEQRTAEATEEPWFQGRNSRSHESTRDVYSKREPHEPDSHDIATYMYSEEDAAFIVAARTVVPAMTAAIRDVLKMAAEWEAGAPDRIVGEAVASDIRAAIAAHLDLTDPEGEPT